MTHHTAQCEPLVVALYTNWVQKCCHFCLRTSKESTLKRCSACGVVFYCSQKCQHSDWKDMHKMECKYFQGKREMLQDGSMDVVSGLLLFRLLLKHENGRLENCCGTFSGKTFKNLMTHEAEMRQDIEQMQRFESLVRFVQALRGCAYDEQLTFEIFAKLDINSYSIDVWPAFDQSKYTSIGKMLAIDLAAYNHSCRPNAYVHLVGRQINIIPLDPQHDAHDTTTTKIAYIGLLHTTAERKERLRKDWYFDCECERCLQQNDNFLNGICCSKCLEAVAFDATQKLNQQRLKCGACGSQQSTSWVGECLERKKLVKNALHNILTKPNATNQQKLQQCQSVLKQINGYLPKCELGHADLLSLYGTLSSNDPTTAAQCQVDFYHVWTLCYPRYYGGVFLQIALETCHSLLVAKRFDEGRKLLNEVKETVQKTFTERFCAFQPRLTYLEMCLKWSVAPCSDLQWETLEHTKTSLELTTIVNSQSFINQLVQTRTRP